MVLPKSADYSGNANRMSKSGRLFPDNDAIKPKDIEYKKAGMEPASEYNMVVVTM